MGLCRTKKTYFALIPDFVLFRRKISKLGLTRLSDYYAIHRRLLAAIDDWMDGLNDDFYLPRSTAAHYLKLNIRAPPVGSQ
jgi:hypothetical protein